MTRESELTSSLRKELFRQMLRIRCVEETIAERYAEQEMRCPTHLCTGQEGVPAAAGLALRKDDFVVSNHRAHGHYLAKGGDLPSMLAEIYGRAAGCSRGKGGSMHLVDLDVNFMGSTAIVGGTVPVGVGLGLSIKLHGSDQVSCVFLGDAAIEEGVFYESINFAILKKLPVLFVCENNLYSVYSPLGVRQPTDRAIHERVRGLGTAADAGDGNDAEEVYRKITRAIGDVREGGGPWFLEFTTYRWREHCGPNYDNDLGYRAEEEFLEWKARDPIRRMRRRLLAADELNDAAIAQTEAEILEEVDAAFLFARESPFPETEEAFSGVYAGEEDVNGAAEPTSRGPNRTGGVNRGQRGESFAAAVPSVGKRLEIDSAPRTVTYAQAINEALHLAMEMDDSVICYGLGTPDPKGVFGTTVGLQERFGGERVFDMPASENAMTGVAIGASLNGIRPVVTHQRVDFFLLAMDQLVNNAAKWHYMFGGRQSVPITIRLIIGRGWGQGPTHSQNLQAWFAHVPGLKVVVPTTPSDAKGLLLASIFDENPVVFIEHRWLHYAEGEVLVGDCRTPLGRASIVREGSDVSLVGTSIMTVEAIRASDHLREAGISCDVVDLRSVSPLDWDTVLNSVRKTGRLLALDGGWSTGSVAGEILARVATGMGSDLRCNPRRLGLPDVPTPTSRALTKDFYPHAGDIVRAVGDMLGQECRAGELAPANRPSDVPGDWFKGPF